MVLTKTASQSDVSVHSTFASRYVRHSLPRYKMPENSIPKEAAYQIINDELMLDGNRRLNLARIRADDRRKEGEKKAAAAEGGEKKADGGGKKEAGPMTVVLGAGKKDTGVAVSHGGGFKVEVKGKLKRRRQRWSEVVVEESMVREREKS